MGPVYLSLAYFDLPLIYPKKAGGAGERIIITLHWTLKFLKFGEGDASISVFQRQMYFPIGCLQTMLNILCYLEYIWIALCHAPYVYAGKGNNFMPD